MKKYKYVIKHFKEIKDQLVLNKNLMFYFYEDIPVLCYHKYLELSGVSNYNISIECSVKNICKYCGESLETLSIFSTLSQPPIITVFVYYILEIFGAGDQHSRSISKQIMDSDQKVNTGYDDVDMEYQRKDKTEKVNLVNNNSIFLYVYNMFIMFILSKVTPSDEKYLEKVGCLAAGFAYKICLDAEIDVDSNGFKKKIENFFFQSGFGLNVLEKILSVCPSTNNIINVLLHGFKRVSVSNPLKTLVKDQYNLYVEYNKIIRDYYWKYCRKPVIQDLKSIDKATSNVKHIVIDEYSTSGYNQFNVFLSNHCPEHVIHSYKDDVCEFCGVKKDLSNAMDLYKKYYIDFHDGSILKTKQNSIKD
jgi:hypothetical protein